MIGWTKNLSPTRTCHLTIASNKLFATRGMLLTSPLLKLRLPDPKNRRRQEVRPCHQVGSSTSYQLAQQIVIINQKHSAQLEVQKRIFELQLQKRDEQLDKLLKGMEWNVNPEQIPRYEIQGGFFNWSALKMTKCQTLRKFWHLELFWRDLHVIWHLVIF